MISSNLNLTRLGVNGSVCIGRRRYRGSLKLDNLPKATELESSTPKIQIQTLHPNDTALKSYAQMPPQAAWNVTNLTAKTMRLQGKGELSYLFRVNNLGVLNLGSFDIWGQRILCCGGLSRVSTHQVPITLVSPPSCDNSNYFQTLLNIPWETKLTLIE